MPTRQPARTRRKSSSPAAKPRPRIDGTDRCALHLELHRSSRRVAVTIARVREVAQAVLDTERVLSAELSIAIVNDNEIHRVNREHLGHDYPTDVISFLYAAQRSDTTDESRRQRRGRGLSLEGELIVSDEMASREAPRHGWTAQSELLLYIIHGLLHLCGYDDLTPSERRLMRRRERELTSALGLS